MMSRTQRTITIGLWGVVVVCLLGLLALLAAERTRAHARARNADALAAALGDGAILERNADGTFRPATTQPVLDLQFPAPTFALTDQNQKPFDAAALKGKVWTAMFFFSECKGVCPSMRERIESLQHVAADARVHCVSFTADPARDNPERLKKYAVATGIDESRWHLLTGTREQMQAVASGFMLPFDQPTDHSSKIVLVGPDGVVRGFYDSQDTAAMFRLLEDTKKLLATLPSTQPTAAAQ